MSQDANSHFHMWRGGGGGGAFWCGGTVGEPVSGEVGDGTVGTWSESTQGTLLLVTCRRMSNDESCVCCMSCPRAVRTQPCGHAIYCELCTIRAVQAKGLKCGVCRGAVLQLVVVPVNHAGDPPHLRSIQTYQAEPEPEGSVFESVDAFLQAKLGSDDAEVAEAAQAALTRVSEQEGEEEEEEEDPLFPIDAQGHAT
eukprot:scaffold44215_cov69-Phaeocystis_antarctica.AAC.13